jgi:putative hydrolase of the HAD superfamily
VLFDLDDTVFDHKHSRLCGLKALQDRYPELSRVPLRTLEAEHEALLQADYGRVLDGAVSFAEGRVMRARGLLTQHGIDPDDEEAGRAAKCYGEAYDRARRPVPGVEALLQRLRPWAALGIVTNGVVEQQAEKLRVCGLEGIFDAVIVSEAVGVRKPDARIFLTALDTLGASAVRTTFVGDSWSVDIIPARTLGLRAVWLNRYGLACPDRRMATEIGDYADLDADAILGR